MWDVVSCWTCMKLSERVYAVSRFKSDMCKTSLAWSSMKCSPQALITTLRDTSEQAGYIRWDLFIKSCSYIRFSCSVEVKDGDEV